VLKNIYDIVLQNEKIYGNKIAVKDNKRSYTYSEMRNQIEEISGILRGKGLKKGDRVAILLPNSYAFIATFFSCSKEGIICVPLNWINNPLNIKYILKDAGCCAIVSYKNKLEEIMEDDVEVSDIWEDIFVAMIEKRNGARVEEEGTLFGDINLLLYTSGSTGQAKGVMLTHFNMYIGAKIVAEYLKMSEDDIVLALLPFSFDYGLNQVISTFFVAGTLIIRYPYLIFEIPQIIEKERITGFAGIPTIWVNLMNQRNIRKYDYSSLRYITNSGEAIPDRYLDTLEEVFQKTDIYLMYGLTECFRCTYLEPEMYHIKRGSIGRAIPGCEVMVINDEGVRCEKNEVGELYFRGPTVAKGYWGIEESSVFVENPFISYYKEMVVRSGDLVYEDEEGYLYFVGRKDKMIKKDGYRTNGFQIANEILNNCSFVKACCVIGVRDKDGQHIIAFVELKDGESVIDREKDIMEYSKKQLPMYMRLDKTIIMSKIPKLNSNKYDISKLELIANKEI